MPESASNSHQDHSSYVCVVRQSNIRAGEMLHSFLQELGLQILTREIAAIWTGDGSPFASQIMKGIFEHVQAAIILFGEDEQVRLSRRFKKDNKRSSENKFVFRPSLDLVFEAGYAFGCFPKGVILLRMGQVSLFSDIDGRYIANFSETKSEQLNLIHRLRTLGCTLTVTTNGLRNLERSSGIGTSDLLALTSADLSPQSSSHNGAANDNDGTGEKAQAVDPRRVFVVYGRNRRVKDAVFAFLRSIGLLPIEWEEAVQSTLSGAPYIGEVLEALVRQAQAALVLLTGDDEVKPERHSTEHGSQPAFQPRPNVIFEAGMAFGNSWLEKKTLLLELGKVEVCHALEGHHRFSHSNDAKHYWDLIDTLQRIGCKVEIKDEDVARRLWINISRYY